MADQGQMLEIAFAVLIWDVTMHDDIVSHKTDSFRFAKST